MYDPDVNVFFSEVPGEWFELFNLGTDTINLRNWVFRDLSTPAQTFTITTNLSIGPGQFKVVGASSNTAFNGNVTVDFAYGISAFTLSNNGDAIIMTDSDGVERDRVVYGSSFPDPSGASISLNSPALDNSMGINWCPSGTVWLGSTANDRGTPGAPNVCA
jgi:uncharacterized protein